MEIPKIVTGCCLMVIGWVGVLTVVIDRYLTAGQEMALLAGVVVAVGLPLVAIWTYWWVNESVYRSSGGRPPVPDRGRYR